MKLITNLVEIPVIGHGLEMLGNILHEPHAKGRLAADTVTGTDGAEYALFTIIDDGTQPAKWAGTYRLDLKRLIAQTTDLSGKCRIERIETK